MAEELAEAPVQTDQPPAKYKLWQSLNAAHYYTKSYDEFEKQFSSPETINKLHSALSGAGYYTKSSEDFNQQFFSPEKKKDTSSVDFTHGYKPTPQDIQQKKTLEDVQRTSEQSGGGSKSSQNTNSFFSDYDPNKPVQPRKDAQEWKQLFDENVAAQKKFGKPEDPIKTFEKEQVVKRKKEQADFDKLPLSEKVKSVSNSIVSGAGDILKGAERESSNILQWMFNPDDPRGKQIRENIANAAKGDEDLIDKGVNAISFKMPEKDKELINTHGLTGAINGFANFLPAMATAERTGGASFFFNDYEKGYEQIDKLDPKLSEGQKQLYATLRGTASALLMSHGLGSAISAGGEKAEQATIDAVSKDAINNMAKAGEDLTPENVKAALTKNITTRALQYAEQSAKGLPKSVATMIGLEGVNIGIEKLVNTTSGKKIFKQNDIAQRMENAVVNGLGLHLAGSLIGATSLLAKGSEQRNDVAESLYHDPSDENVANIKSGLTDHLKEQGHSDEDIAHAHNVVDQLHEVTKDMPKGIKPEKVVQNVEKSLNDRKLFEQQKAAMNNRITDIDEAIKNNDERPAVTPAEIADKEVVAERLEKERESLNNDLKKTISKQYEERSKPVEEVPVETPKEDAQAKEEKPDKTIDEKGGDTLVINTADDNINVPKSKIVETNKSLNYLGYSDTEIKDLTEKEKTDILENKTKNTNIVESVNVNDKPEKEEGPLNTDFVDIDGPKPKADKVALEKELDDINKKLELHNKDDRVENYLPYSVEQKLLKRKAEIEKELAPHEPVTEGAAAVVLPFTKEFIEHDVKPLLQNIATNVKEAFEKIAKAIRPQIGVNPKDVDTITKNINQRNEEAAKIDKLVNTYEKMFDKMKDPERIDFIDRIKRGLPQPTPELQQIADQYKIWDKDMYDAIKEFKDNIPFKENHFRVLWKTIPGTEKPRSWFGRAKRPLEGSKGFLKRATLTDMSEGIRKGGEPISTNPMTMFKLAHADVMKFVTAHRMFDALKEDGVVKFVKTGKEVPEGYTKINDKIANVYFPVKEGLVKAGEYYIEKNAGRMVNNLLSEDKLRNTAIGKGIMALKNFYTAIELSMSPFHATVMSLEAVSSDIGRGIRKTMSGDLREGIKDVLKAPFAPKTTFSLGRKYINLASQKDFENSPIGKKFLENNPLAREYLHDFFSGGGLTRQDNSYKLQAYQGLKDQLAKDNYIGATLRLPLALNEMVMTPLFDTYIPALKVGMFMKEFPVSLKENAGRLEKGDITREALARKTVDFIDDRLGEMNFDNLYWDRTFKTATQLFFRSVTWKLGNARALGGAIPEQGMEFYNAMKEGRHPILQPKMAWFMGMCITHAAVSTLVQYGFTGTTPQTFKDLLWPRLSKDDDKDRAVVPDYFRDITSISNQGLGSYVKNSMAGDNTKILDVWNNSDFQKYQIVDHKDPLYKQGEDAMKYMLPQPIGFSQIGKDIKKNTPIPERAAHFIGLSPAPKYVTNTPIENKIYDLYNVQEGINTRAMKEKSELKGQIRELYKSGKVDDADKMLDKAINDGDLKVTEIKPLLKSAAEKENPSVYLFNSLKDDKDKIWLYNQMTEKEKEEYDPHGKIGALAEQQAEREKGQKKKDKPYSSFK